MNTRTGYAEFNLFAHPPFLAGFLSSSLIRVSLPAIIPSNTSPSLSSPPYFSFFLPASNGLSFPESCQHLSPRCNLFMFPTLLSRSYFSSLLIPLSLRCLSFVLLIYPALLPYRSILSPRLLPPYSHFLLFFFFFLVTFLLFPLIRLSSFYLVRLF